MSTLAFIRRLPSKIDIGPIIRSHWATLRNEDTGDFSMEDLFVFYTVPLLAALFQALFDLRISGLSTVLTALALLVGLLFNLLVLIFDLTSRMTRAELIDSTNDHVRLLKETQANTAYALLLGLVIVTVLGAASLSASKELPLWISCLLGGLIIHFVLTLLMVLRRIRSAFLAQFV
jgi:hypothetical protein